MLGVVKRFSGSMSLSKLRNTGFIAVKGDDFRTLCTPRAFRDRIYELISAPTKRIYITALYLQDDDGGRGILNALYEAKEKNPALDVKVFVDFHRAQRGLIGAKASAGNQVLYQECESRWPGLVQVYGVPVRRYEMMGVLHLKGFVFDEHVGLEMVKDIAGEGLYVYAMRHGDDCCEPASIENKEVVVNFYAYLIVDQPLDFLFKDGKDYSEDLYDWAMDWGSEYYWE